jgi:hypothetical protein
LKSQLTAATITAVSRSTRFTSIIHGKHAPPLKPCLWVHRLQPQTMSMFATIAIRRALSMRWLSALPRFPPRSLGGLMPHLSLEHSRCPFPALSGHGPRERARFRLTSGRPRLFTQHARSPL